MSPNPERDLCRAVLRSCIVDIAHGAGISRPPKPLPGMPAIVAADRQHRQRTTKLVDGLEISVAWLNGCESPLTFRLVCDFLDRDPVRWRKTFAAELGIVTEGPDHALRGPFSLAHGAIAAELMHKADLAERLDAARFAGVDSDGGSVDRA